MAAHFEESLDKDANMKRGVVAKGAFRPTFDGECPEGRTTEESKSVFPKKRSRPLSI